MTAPKIDVLPPAPSRANPTAFAAESDAVLAAQADFVTQANNLGTYVEVQANTVGPSLSYAEQAAASAALALIYKNDAAAAVTYQDLAAFALSKAITMVGGDVYRTANDSDGGAWRERTQSTSWYQETLDTATRGSTRKFPSVAIPMAESSTLTIYNADDPAAPVWKILDFTGFTITSLAVVNGTITVGTTTGVVVLDFIKDEINVVLKYTTATTPAIVNNSVNDVKMTVLPNAPIDHATGLQITTIALGTAGGISVINNDETVANGSEIRAAYHVDFGLDGSLYYSFSPLAQLLNVVFPDTYLADGFSTDVFYNRTIPQTITTGKQNILGFASGVKGINPLAVGTTSGLTFITPNFATPANGMVAYGTTTYNSGHQIGEIKGAFLSSTAITSLVAGDTDADRSVNANGLIVNGTVNRDHVATGADLVGYSGWSAANYLEQPYNSDLDFGTGDFSVMGWVKPITGGYGQIVDSTDASSVEGFTIRQQFDDVINFIARSSSSTISVNTNAALPDGEWTFFVCNRTTAGTVNSVYLNGFLDVTATGSAVSIGGTDVPMRIGLNKNDNFPLNGSLALLRISATAPSAEQIAKAYHDERALFQPGAQSTIYGASDAVTAIAHDKGTDLLHVGTSAGRSVFSGLQRVSNTVVAVPGVISASNDLVIEG
jgi:hypothetical protein